MSKFFTAAGGTTTPFAVSFLALTILGGHAQETLLLNQPLAWTPDKTLLDAANNPSRNPALLDTLAPSN